MTISSVLLKILAILLVGFMGMPALGQKTMDKANKFLYKVKLTESASRTVTVSQSGKMLQIIIDGFANSVRLKANGGGTETCRTFISHRGGGLNVVLSLPIPFPNTPCQMTPGTITLEGGDFGESREREVTKISGNDGQLRLAVEKAFGKLTRTSSESNE